MILEEYDNRKDVAIYKGEGHFVNLEEKHFLILFPTDVHMPGIAINIPKAVKKVVVKVSTDYLEPQEVQEDKETAVEITPHVEENTTQVSE